MSREQYEFTLEALYLYKQHNRNALAKLEEQKLNASNEIDRILIAAANEHQERVLWCEKVIPAIEAKTKRKKHDRR